jgi:cytochrome b6-f complex iron-sulfur subunit
MNRRDLVQKVLLGSTALVFIPSAFTACKKDTSTGGNNIIIDLSLPENSALNNTGGSKIVGSIIVANTGNDKFVALEKTCTHEGCTVAYNSTASNFQCPCHQSVYSTTGIVLSGPAPTALTSHSVSKSGNILTITV